MKQESTSCSPSEPRTLKERLDRSLLVCGHYLYHHAAGPRQTVVVQLLQKNGPMSQQDIQQALEIQPGSVSELISKLETKGFLVRQRDETDKRKVTISLTPRGMALEEKPREQVLTERYAALEPQEQELLTELMEKLLRSWGAGGYDK